MPAISNIAFSGNWGYGMEVQSGWSCLEFISIDHNVSSVLISLKCSSVKWSIVSVILEGTTFLFTICFFF